MWNSAGHKDPTCREELALSASYRFAEIGLPASMVICLFCCFLKQLLEFGHEITIALVTLACIDAFLRWVALPRVSKPWQLDLLTLSYVVPGAAANIYAVVEHNFPYPLISISIVIMWAALSMRSIILWGVLVLGMFIACAWIFPGTRTEAVHYFVHLFMITPPVACAIRIMVLKSYEELLRLRESERDLLRAYQKTVAELQDSAETHEQAERERLAMQGELFEARRRESLGTMAARVAHDFNNFLLAILSFAEAISRSQPGSDAALSAAEIKVAANNASAICNEMLLIAGKSSEDRAVVDLKELVLSMQGLLRATIPKNCPLRVKTDEGVLPVQIDKQQIRQALVNVVNNAADAMQPAGGFIVVTVHGQKNADDLIQPRPWASGQHGASTYTGRNVEGSFCGIRVTDSGCGMPQEVMNRAFDPYYTTKASGNGLGLATANGILEAHDGGIKIDSWAKGTSVDLVLPMSDLPVATESPRQSVEVDFEKGHILVIDDEPHVRKAVSTMLKTMGWTVSEAEGGNAGIKLFHRDQDKIDAVIVDFTMPDMDGYEVIRKLRSDYAANVPIILCSGYLPEAKHQDDACAPDLILNKPYSIDELTTVLGSSPECRA